MSNAIFLGARLAPVKRRVRIVPTETDVREKRLDIRPRPHYYTTEVNMPDASLNKRKIGRNRRAKELFVEFLDLHCPPCRRARGEKRPGWKPLMSACERCGPATGAVFAEFLDVWGPEIEEYAKTRPMASLGSHYDWEDLVSDFRITLQRVWYSGFVPGRGDLAHYMWRAVHNTWSRVIGGAFRRRNTIEREQARDDLGEYGSGVPAARVTSPLDAPRPGGDPSGPSLADKLPDPARSPDDSVADKALADEVRGKIIRRLAPLDQAVFSDIIVNRRLEPCQFAEEHRITVALVRQRVAVVEKVLASVAQEYREYMRP